jgi:Flp pilus assembly protein TadG
MRKRLRLGARLVGNDEGQTIVIVAVAFFVFIGMLGLIVDVGVSYLDQRQLQTATDAAALAAAQDLPNGATAATTACSYSAGAATDTCNENGVNSLVGGTGGKNTNPDLPAGVAVTAQPECLSVATAGISCIVGPGCPAGTALPPSGTAAGGCNAIRVTETVTVKPIFMAALGFGSRKLTTSATASMAGGSTEALDVEVVLDSTASMGFNQGTYNLCSSDVPGITRTSHAPTKLDCANDGVRSLLGALYPCGTSLATCGTPVAGNVPNPLDEVGLMTFPGLSSAAKIPDELDCIKNISTGDLSYASGANYQIVPLSSDYRTSDTAGPNYSSNLFKATYWSGCPGGIYPPDGGAQGSSIGGAASASDRSSATSTSAQGIGGAAAAGDESSGSSAATIGGAVTGGPNYSSSGSTGSGSANSVTVARSNTRAAGDYVLVTVTAEGGIGTAGHICAPDATWTQIRSDVVGSSTANRVIEATFGSIRPNANAENFTFSFYSGACGVGVVSSVASAIAITYTNVDPLNPVDLSAANTGTSTSLTAPAVTTTSVNDDVVRIYGTGAGTSFSNNTAPSAHQASSSTVTGMIDAPQAAPGDSGTAGGVTTSSSGNWVAQTIALRPLALTSVTVPRPSTQVAGDFMLVTVTAEGGIGTAGHICAPDASWTLIRSDVSGTTTANDVIEATFWSVRPGAGAENYKFSFYSGACGGTPVASAASAIAVRATGVDSVAPVDVISPLTVGTSTTLSAPSVSTTSANDLVLRIYGSGAGTSFNGGAPPALQASTSTITGVNDGFQATPGASGAAGGVTTATSGNWVAQTIALRPQLGPPSITIARPANTAAGDLILASVTASGLGSGAICPPSDSDGWTLVGTETTSGVLTQATFWSTRSAAGAQNYTFTFVSGTCAAPGGSVSVAASAVAIRYTGVNPVLPVDVFASATGSGTRPSAPSVTTGPINDQVVRMYGSASSTLTGTDISSASGSPTTGSIDDGPQATPGATGTDATPTTASTSWVAQTIALQGSSGSCSGQCFYGLEDPGGVNTYYAGAITAAQNALALDTRQAQKVIILLSDGDANTSAYGTAPCHQAITAAGNAENTGTWIYTIAYNSPASGCAYDTGSNAITPICTLHKIADPTTDCSNNASDPAHRFYVQPADGDLTAIFQQIGSSLASTRLVSDSAT